MAYSIADYTGDGVTAYFPIPFPYGPDSEIQVLVDNVTVIPQSIVAQLVYLPSAPANGAEVTVRRFTSIAAPSVDFEDGAMLTERDLDRAFQQILYAAQESLDASERVISGLVLDELGDDLLDGVNAQIASVNGQIDTITTDLADAVTRITNAENADGVHDTNIQNLETTATQLQTGVTANSNSLIAQETRITEAEGDIASQGLTLTSHGSAITQLISDLSSAEGDIAANLSAINGLITALSTTDGNVTANASDIAQLQLDIAGTATSGAVSALDARVSSVEGTVTSQASDITQLETDVAGKASSASVSALDSRVSNVEGDVTTQSSDITQLQTDVAGKASSSALTALDTRVTSTEGTVASQSSSISSLTSSLGTNTSNITALTSTVNGLEARWDIKTNVNDLVGGVGFYNDGSSTKFVIDADNTIAGGTITGATINGSTIQTTESGERATLSSSDNRLHFFWDEGAGVEEYLEFGKTTVGADSYAIRMGGEDYSSNGIYGFFESGADATFLFGLNAHNYLSYSNSSDTLTPTLDLVGGYQSAIHAVNTAFSAQPTVRFTTEVNSAALVLDSNAPNGSTARTLEVRGNSDLVRAYPQNAGRAAFKADHEGNNTYGLECLMGTNDNCRGVYIDADSGSADGCYGVYAHMGGANTYGVYSRVDDATGYSFYANGVGANYGPFTGAHDALVPKAHPEIEPGDIIKRVGVAAHSSVSNVIHYVELQDTDEAQNTQGIYTARKVLPDENEVSALSELTQAEYDALQTTHDYLVINALGEGRINVCDAGGNIEDGDCISSSAVAGKGKRYAGNDVRKIVAFATEAVDWSQETESVKQISCTYFAR